MNRMIRIKMMKEEAYKSLKFNYKHLYKKILENPDDADWLESYIGYDPYEEEEYEIEDYEIDDSEDNKNITEDEAIKMYEKLNHLPRNIICNNRFWAWLLFKKFYKQAQKWIEKSEGIIKTRWIIGNSRRDLMLGVVSRNYFKIECSVMKENEDKYKFSRYIINNHNPYKNITFRNIGMIKNVVFSYLRLCIEMENKYEISLNDDFCSTLMKFASNIGSTRLIDVMEEEEIYNILKPKIEKYIIENIIKNR